MPECMWTGKDVDISSLRIFGCSAFVLQNGDKLDPRAKKCIFIGYPDGVKGYRLWLRSQPGYKVIVSRDVTFNEYEFPCAANSPKKDTDLNKESTFNKVEENSEDNQQGEEVEIEENQQSGNEKQNENNTSSIRNYQLARDRERRTTRIPSKFRDFDIALNTDTSEPFSYEEALETTNSENWIKAMNEEIDSLIKTEPGLLCQNQKMRLQLTVSGFLS
ncbi:UNVERIFIED_CONTAM: hypothetical protein Sradi_0159000 [Sesamum radiatum]|uniref:Retroviral polymerase SH3-like domain-containing protein n=1 Tax=Sesamum radiatum TaxID=300843 RepID=A0AAW2WN40_SESRA